MQGANTADMNLTLKDNLAENINKDRSNSPNRMSADDKHSLAGDFANKRNSTGNNPNVNEIIVKIEMKKF